MRSSWAVLTDRQRISDGRHVGLDFYDLLIEGPMGGDDSQKLLPWRGLHSSPGRKPPAYLQNNTLAQRHLLSAVMSCCCQALAGAD